MCAKIIYVALSNNDEAVFVNDCLVASLDSTDTGESLSNLGEKLAESLNTPLRVVSMDVPNDEDWNWDDVLELIPEQDSNETKQTSC